MLHADPDLIRQQSSYNHSLIYSDLDGHHNQTKNNKTGITNQTHRPS